MPKKNYTPIHHLLKKNRDALTGSSNKESLPSYSKPTHVEYEMKAEHTIQDPEVKEFVEERLETVDVPKEVKAVGVKPVANPQFTTYNSIKLPLSEEKIPLGLSAPVDSSFKWLATLANYILQQSQGHAVRAHKGITALFKR